MKKSGNWFRILVGVIVFAGIGFFLLPFLGLFPIAATGKANILDWWGHMNMESYLTWRVHDRTIPRTADSEKGFEHYLAMCIHCHGGPGVSGQEWSSHMLPRPPKLWEGEVKQELSDGQLFYIITNGIRMTGMPAFGPIHDEEDIWNIVAIVRQLDQLTEQQKQKLHERASSFAHD